MINVNANALVQYLGSCAMIVVGLRAAYRTNYSPARLSALALCFAGLAAANIGFGCYFTFAEARTQQNILTIITGVNWAVASGAFFYASSRKRRMAPDTQVTA